MSTQVPSMINIDKFGDKNLHLVTFLWNLIDVCNYKCSYCNAPHGRNEKDFKNFTTAKRYPWKNVLKRLSVKKVGKFEVQILGGEPTLHPDFKTIVHKLCNNENCTEIEIFTNLSKSQNYFEQFNCLPYKKLVLLPAYHSEHYNKSFVKKIINLHNIADKFTIIPVINLSDKKEDWPVMFNMIDAFKTAGVKYRLNFLHAEPKVGYTPNYTAEFWETFDSIFRCDWEALTRNTGQPLSADDIIPLDDEVMDPVHVRDLYTCGKNIDFDYNGKRVVLRENDIIKHKLNRFKEWNCRAQLYYIDLNGIIQNYCTGEILPPYFNTEQLTCFKTCPHKICDRRAFVYNNKLHYYRERKDDD